MTPADDEGLRNESGAFRPGWTTVAASMLGLATGPGAIIAYGFAVFAPAIRHEHGWSIGATSAGAMVLSLTLAFVSPLQGLLADRIGSRRLSLFSLPLYGLTLMAFSQLPADIRFFYLSCAALALLGIGVWPLSFMRMVSTWFSRRLGLALGIANAGLGLGAALAPVAFGIGIATIGWRTTFIVLGAIELLVVFPILFRWAHERPLRQKKAGVPAAPLSVPGITLAATVREKAFWLLMLGFLALGFWSGGMVIHQADVLTEHGLSRGTVVGLQALVGIASIAGRIIGGLLLDRIPAKRLMAALIGAALAVSWLYTSSAPVFLLALGPLAIGFIVGSEADILSYATRGYFGLRSFGAIYGLIFAGFQIGSAAGAYGMGAMRDATHDYTIGLLVLALAALVALAAFLMLGRYRFVDVERRSPA